MSLDGEKKKEEAVVAVGAVAVVAVGAVAVVAVGRFRIEDFLSFLTVTVFMMHSFRTRFWPFFAPSPCSTPGGLAHPPFPACSGCRDAHA
jgi:hypothetical protein